MAHLAGHVDVGQEVHLHALHPVALAGLAPPALHVEAEAARGVAVHPRLGQEGEEVADQVEELGVGRGVAAGGPADGTLVDVDDLVDPVKTLDPGVFPRHQLGAVEVTREGAVKDVAHQRGLPRSRHPGHGGEDTKGDLDVQVAEVVLARADDPEHIPFRRLAALLGHAHPELFPQIARREGGRVLQDIIDLPLDHHVPAVLPRPGSQVDDVVGGADGLLVVLDHDHRVAEVAEFAEGAEEACVVALVEADARLIQDIEHAYEAGADLGREPDPLRFAAGKTCRAPTQGQVSQSDISKEAEPVGDLLQDRTGHIGIEPGTAIAAHRELLEEAHRQVHRHLDHVADALPADGHRERLGLEPASLADRAGALDHEGLEFVADGVARGLLVASLDVLEHPFPLRLVLGPLPSFGHVLEHLSRHSVYQRVTCSFAVGAPGRGEVELEGLGKGRQDDFAQRPARFPPGEDHPFENGDLPVAEHEVGVDLASGADAVTLGAGAEGTVEGELPRLELREGEPAGGAAELLGKNV